MARVYFHIPEKFFPRVNKYLENQAKRNYQNVSQYVNSLVMRDYHLNTNTVSGVGLQYDVDITTNTMTIQLPPEMVEILGLKQKTVLVDLK